MRGWNLRTLLDHLIESVSTLAEGFATGSVGPEPAYAAIPRADRGNLGTDPVASLQLRCAELLTACATAPPNQMIVLGSHDLTTSLMSYAGAIEIAVHGWDILAACGSPQPIPSALAGRLLLLAPLLVTDTTRVGQFGEPVPAPTSAPAGDRLVAFLGRNPAWPAAASQLPPPRRLRLSVGGLEPACGGHHQISQDIGGEYVLPGLVGGGRGVAGLDVQGGHLRGLVLLAGLEVPQVSQVAQQVGRAPDMQSHR